MWEGGREGGREGERERERGEREWKGGGERGGVCVCVYGVCTCLSFSFRISLCVAGRWEMIYTGSYYLYLLFYFIFCLKNRRVGDDIHWRLFDGVRGQSPARDCTSRVHRHKFSKVLSTM
jgi:hypothetical protein